MLAEEAGITVTDDEVQESIINDQSFMNEGVFSMLIYRNSLRQNRMTPKFYEAQRRNEILIRKYCSMITAAADLDDIELNDFIGDPADKAAMRMSLIEAKKKKLMNSYIVGMRSSVPMTINEQLLN